MSSDRATISPHIDGQPVTKRILAALQGLRFGSVEITVHEGNIVQIERREKLRLNLICPDVGHRERQARGA